MATVTVVNDNIGGHLEVYYSFSANVSARTWSLYSELRLVIPSGATYGAWNATGAHGGNLVGNGIGSLGAGTHTLDSYSTSGYYNSNGDAPSVNISWAFNVRSSWAGYWDNYGSITATGSPIGPDGTPPTGLAATLIDAGPDWADISMSISSWGSPSTSATRYIEAAVLGTSTYDNPYKCKTATAVMSETFHIDNTCGGNLTITPNTQYRVGGCANNQTRDANTVGATFTTLPAVPIINAVDQGHGVIDVTVTHANEGSALSITEEYSIDDGATWTTITGGAFSLTLSAQTVLTVRRSSTAGVSSGTVTVAPHFDVAIYASVLNKSKLITKVYAPWKSGSSKLASVSNGQQSGDFDVTVDSSEFFVTQFNSNLYLYDTVRLGGRLLKINLIYREATHNFDIEFVFNVSTQTISNPIIADWGLNVYGSDLQDGDRGSLALICSYEDIIESKKVAKIYASVAGKTKLVFEDPS